MVNDGSWGCVLSEYRNIRSQLSYRPWLCKGVPVFAQTRMLQYDRCKLVGRYVSSVCTLYVESHWHFGMHKHHLPPLAKNELSELMHSTQSSLPPLTKNELSKFMNSSQSSLPPLAKNALSELMESSQSSQAILAAHILSQRPLRRWPSISATDLTGCPQQLAVLGALESGT